MKDKYNNDKEPNYYSKCIHLGDLDRLAREIDTVARGCLRDGVLGGILSGHEEDIRQDAILLILRWVLRGEQKSHESDGKGSVGAKGPWNLSAVVASALRIGKLRMARRLAKEVQGRETLSETIPASCPHHSDLSPWDWSDPVRRDMALLALRIAVKSGQLSYSNECVAILILKGGMSVDEVADLLNVSRGAIYQQLRRVKRILPSIIEGMEPPNP